MRALKILITVTILCTSNGRFRFIDPHRFDYGRFYRFISIEGPGHGRKAPGTRLVTDFLQSLRGSGWPAVRSSGLPIFPMDTYVSISRT